MAELPLVTAYTDVVGARDIAVQITAETHVIDAQGVVELVERPDETHDIIVPGFVVVDYYPLDTATCQSLPRSGRLQFLPELEGTTVEVTYYGVGTILRDDHINTIHAALNRIERRNINAFNWIIAPSGNLSYTTGTLTFPSTLKLYTLNDYDEGETAYTITGGAVALADGAILYVALTDSSETNLTISSAESLEDYAALSAATKFLAYRSGASVYLWNGYKMVTGETYDSLATRSYVNTQIASNVPDHNDLGGLNEGDYLHLTAAEMSLANAVISAAHTQNTDTAMGTWTTNIAAGGYKLTGLGAPENNYDAAHKYYVDTAIAAVRPVYCVHYQDVLAADNTAFMSNPGGIGNGSVGPTTQPDVPRQIRIYVNVTGGGGSGKTATFVLTGVSANGEIISQTWSAQDLGTELTLLSNAAFALGTSLVVTGVSSPCSGTFIVGYTDVLGLPNYPFAATPNVFKIKKNNTDITVPTVNTTYGTVDCATISGGDDFTFWYKP